MIKPNLVHDLPPYDELRNVRVVVETPRGANIKLKFDDKLGCFSLTRILPLGVTYPYDFGFVPQTLAQDGDPLDVMILIDAVTYPGVVIPCRLLGALQIEERGMRGRQNHRILAVPAKAALKDDVRDVAGLGERMQKELERFFVTTTAFTAKDPQLRGWVGPEAATEMVTKSIQRYRERYQRGSYPQRHQPVQHAAGPTAGNGPPAAGAAGAGPSVATPTGKEPGTPVASAGGEDGREAGSEPGGQDGRENERAAGSASGPESAKK